MQEKGIISVHSENIFPIIKKFLYSDHEVFLRELVSNAVDATQKLKQLSAMGEYGGPVNDLPVQITINEKLKTITISDQGLGMTADEIKKYINQVAFSGAASFIEKYKDKGQAQQLIGFFGLGFYSAFMVANRVDIITQSYQPGEEAVHWMCDGSTTFEMNNAVKKEIGTDVILYLNEDAEDFLQKSKIQELLHKYCKFLPVPIEFDGKVVNNTQPLWAQSPQQLQDKDYLDFYQELYPYSAAPLFWIHLNVDYPFNLTGVLYFPATTHKLAHHTNKIQLYAKQVFITEEVKDIVPPFLMLLHGVIDSPDIPLNVSRSALQADSNVKKINSYITKKVADKLDELFKRDRKAYEDKWPHINLFVKYGMLTEDKFYEKAKDFMLLQTADKEYFTVDTYLEKVKPIQTDNQQRIVLLYATNPTKQDLYIQACTQQGYSVLLLEGQLDSHLVDMLEHKLSQVHFTSVDAAPVEQLIPQNREEQASALTNQEQERLKAIYQKAIPAPSVVWSIVSMNPDELPVFITVPEPLRRLQAMAELQPQLERTPFDSIQATINANHPLAKKIVSLPEEGEQVELAAKAYQLGLLAQNMLQGAELTQFIKRTAAAWDR